MKHMKKLVTLLLTLIMTLALAVPAAAATVKNNTNHAYKAYQIFSGTQGEGETALGDVEWGSGINNAAFLTALKSDSRFNDSNKTNIFASCADAADVASVLAENDSEAIAKAFANVAAQHLTGTGTDIAANATSSVTLDAGYYLLVDVTTPGDGDAMNSALLQVTNKGDIEILKKYSVPTVDKSVKDTDDKWGEAADWCIGSDVPFQLVGTLPENYDDYETYKYVFHDTPCSALQYNGDVKVYVLNDSTRTELTTGFTVTPTTAATTGGGTLTITFDDLKKAAGVTSTSKIVVEYTAKLLANAEIGLPGNSNKVSLEYASNPNFVGTGTPPPTNKTPEDEVLVFTYELDINKVDGANKNKHLANAEFKLENAAGKWATVDADGKVTGWVEDKDKGTVLKTDASGLAKIIGLDAGTYKLYETKAPSGYNQLKDPITIVITATLDKRENNPALTALTIKVGNAAEQNGELSTGTVSTIVENNSGATLPETGGIGTTLFYVVGSVLLVGAAVLLVTRKRMNNTK